MCSLAQNVAPLLDPCVELSVGNKLHSTRLPVSVLICHASWSSVVVVVVVIVVFQDDNHQGWMTVFVVVGTPP